MKKPAIRIIIIIADIVILTISFLAIIWTKPASFRSYIPSHAPYFSGLILIWIIVSFLNGKMNYYSELNFSKLFSRIVTSNVIATSIMALAMYILRDYEYSRTIVLGTAILASFLEFIIGSVYIAYRKALVQDYDDHWKIETNKMPPEYDLVNYSYQEGRSSPESDNINSRVASAINEEFGSEMKQAILQMTGRKLKDHTAVLSTTTIFNINGLVHDEYKYIINLHKINDILRLDDFLKALNDKLALNGYFLCCVETKEQRKLMILKKYPPVINYIYYFFDFIVKRILPKFKLTRVLYFSLTHGHNSVISRAEALGRLSLAGLSIRQESFIGNLLCIEAQKISDPCPVNGTFYGPLIALPRIGKEGKMIMVYKLRTMHAYSEYIQEYVYKLNHLREGGKFHNDFRITSWGAVCRKLWIDELPMLINLFKGEMKLVGVRPLSKHYYELYNKEVRERRIKYKPGLIPPFYADLPDSLESIQASELKYLDSFDQHPVITDFNYFFKSVWNIMFHKVRSN
jgi:lipopolysaccharide/colanic/teichoic acid biosynthesis glycosyltransferase